MELHWVKTGSAKAPDLSRLVEDVIPGARTGEPLVVVTPRWHTGGLDTGARRKPGSWEVPVEGVRSAGCERGHYCHLRPEQGLVDTG